MSPEVSILMAAYNAESLVGRAIESTLNQTFTDFEFIICEDASPDKTKEVIESYTDPRIQILYNEINLGYLETFNKLLEHAKGDYIAFVDADDWVDHRKIELQLKAFDENPNLGLCGSRFAAVDIDSNIKSVSTPPYTNAEIQKFVSNTVIDSFSAGSSVMITQDVLQNIGGYRLYFKGCAGEDMDWMRRIVEQYECMNLPEVLYYYRFHADSLTKVVHEEIRKRHIFEIIDFLSHQRHIHGKDSLETGDYRELNTFIDELSLPYQQDPSTLYRKMGFEYALNNQYPKAIKLMLKALILRPFKIKNYKALLLTTLVLILPMNVLVLLKNKFAKSHISREL
mgnify:CR=1 FL=1